MNNANVCFDERYYAFTGNKIVNWFITKSEGKNYKKVGHKCRFCGAYAGGNLVCHSCVCDCFNISTK